MLWPVPSLDLNTTHHRFETYDFETMYPNLPDAELQGIMLKLLESTFKHQNQHGLRAVELRWDFVTITQVLSHVKLLGYLSNPNQLLLIVRAMYGWDLIRYLDG